MMKEKPKVLVASSSDRDREVVTAALNGEAEAYRLYFAGSSVEALERAGQLKPEVVLLAAGLQPLDHFSTMQKLSELLPGTSGLVLSPHPGPEDYKRALQAGARDVVNLPPTNGDLKMAVEAAVRAATNMRAAFSTSEGSATPDCARRLAVFSTKGGTGKTFISVNLAAGLAQRGKKVALVDLDLQFGDAALALGLVPERTVYDLVQGYNEIDLPLLQEFMLRHSTGLQLLPAPLFPDQSEHITIGDIEKILKVVETGYDYVVVDGPPFFEERILAALDWADEVIHVGSMDLPSLKNMKVSFTTMELMSFPKEKIRVVMNRADSAVGIDLDQAERHLGVKVQHSIPSSIDVPRALNAGEVLVQSKPDAKVAREFLKLVDHYEPAEPDAKSRRFRRLRRS